MLFALRSARTIALITLIAPASSLAAGDAAPAKYQVEETDQEIRIETPQLSAVIRKEGYVSGVAGGSLLDKRTGFRDVGFGLDIVDWIMEPGSDASYRDELPDHMVYHFGNLYHGDRPKRSIEGPQICTKAGRLDETRVIRGDDFVAVQLSFRYRLAAPGHQPGSQWTQTLLFPVGARYFISSDRIQAVNSSDAMFLRIDLPGHIKHKRGDTFSEVYLSYLDRTNRDEPYADGIVPASEFFENFAPDARFNYRRDRSGETPRRFIRAYHLRDPQSGAAGPWLAGMTLSADVVHEAWCHQRGYVCMIEEIGGRPVRAGESFGAAFIVGFFDSPDEMHRVYDRYAGHTAIEVDADGWRLVP